MKKLAILALVLLAILFLGCSEEKVIVWDVDHKPVFPISHYSKLVGVLGGVVEGGVDDIGKANAYVIAGVTKNFTAEEIDKIVDFVENGGKLVVLIHIPPTNVKPLLKKFGVNVSEKPYDVTEVLAVPGEDNAITEGVREIYMRGVFPVDGNLFLIKKEKVIILGGDGRGVAKLVKFGRGEVLVFGDDAMFLNSYITKADNLKLAKNIAKWVN